METATDTPTNFTTERLHLRKSTLEDAVLIHEVYASDKDIPRFMSWVAHTSVSQTEAYMETCLAEWSSGKGFPFIIELSSQSLSLIGMIHMHAFPNRIGFGYVIGRKFWNKGYTSEALKCLVDLSLTQPAIFRAAAFCDVENIASSRRYGKSRDELRGHFAPIVDGCVGG